MAKEWANKDRYHTSHDVLEPRVQLPRAKASVRTVPAWGEQKAVGGAAGRATPVRPVRGTGQTGAGLDRQQFGFRAHTDAKFGSGGRGSSGWSGEFADGQFAGRLPPRDQYEFGRGHSFESQNGYRPRYPFRGSRTPPMGQEWSSHGCSRFDKIDRCIDRHGRMHVANPTFEEMARHWFATFGTNPSVESFAFSRSWF
jgi:hypothetical protein